MNVLSASVKDSTGKEETRQELQSESVIEVLYESVK